jgi:hypothetical protein
MIGTLILMAALVVAICWTIYQQRVVTRLIKRLANVDRRLASAHLTLTGARVKSNDCFEENDLLKEILVDVAKGEAHVWIGEDGLVRATRKPAGEIQIH